MDEARRMLDVAIAIAGPETRNSMGEVIGFPHEWAKVCEIAGHKLDGFLTIEGLHRCVRCNLMFTQQQMNSGQVFLNSSFNRR